MYFFSNSPVKWRLTNVVLPTPPSPTRTSLNSGIVPVVYPSIYSEVCLEYMFNELERVGERKYLSLDILLGYHHR